MIVTGLAGLVFAATAIFLLVIIAKSLPNPYLKYYGYFFIIISFIELLILFWVLVYVAVSDWSLWGLSFGDFWREQLAAIYFIKEWLYTWLWNDILDLFLEIIPAVVILAFRTTLTTILGFWVLASSRKKPG
jgi:hypothetical protein